MLHIPLVFIFIHHGGAIIDGHIHYYRNLYGGVQKALTEVIFATISDQRSRLIMALAEVVSLPTTVNGTKKGKPVDKPVEPIHRPAKPIHGEPPPQLLAIGSGHPHSGSGHSLSKSGSLLSDSASGHRIYEQRGVGRRAAGVLARDDGSGHHHRH